MKYFVVSDVHSFYKELKKALKEKGFDIKNDEHIFVSCGDLFDRGPDAKKCLDFVMSIPKERRFLVKGNHEEMLEKILINHHFTINDAHNRTLDTICQLGNVPPAEVNTGIDVCNRKRKLKAYLNECENYYEIKDYIFCHGFIPIAPEGHDENPKEYYKTASKEDWYWARWDCGFDMWATVKKYYPEDYPDKTIVCGHWHTSYAHRKYHSYKKEWPNNEEEIKDCCFEPFVDNGIIGLDGCVPLTHKVNCIVIEEN